MKQTIVIVSALCLMLLAVSAFIVAGSAQQVELLAQKDALLADVMQKNETLTLEMEKVSNVRDSLSESLTELKASVLEMETAQENAEAAQLELANERDQLMLSLEKAAQEYASLQNRLNTLTLTFLPPPAAPTLAPHVTPPAP